MGSTDNFVAQILESSAVGYAGLTASLLFDRQPDIATRYEPEGFSSWKAQLRRWLLDLSAAIEAGEPALFEARMLWTKKEFTARQASVDDLQAALGALRDVLRERLPEGSVETTVRTVERALAAVAAPAGEEGAGRDPGELLGRPALSYLKTILEGNSREAIEQVLEQVDGGTPVKEAYLNVLIPAQREVGRMWHGGELSIAEEHVVTATTQRLMALLCERERPSSRKDRTVVLACVAGEVHDIGVRAISDFFEMAGWRAINLGPDVPDEEIARGVEFFDADLVVLAATLDPHVKAVKRAIERIRTLEGRVVKIIVGGTVFQSTPDLWRKVGADGHAGSVEDAEPLGSRLIQ